MFQTISMLSTKGYSSGTMLSKLARAEFMFALSRFLLCLSQMSLLSRMVTNNVA